MTAGVLVPVRYLMYPSWLLPGKTVALEVQRSLLGPFRRSASAAEKFVAEIVKYEAMEL